MRQSHSTLALPSLILLRSMTAKPDGFRRRVTYAYGRLRSCSTSISEIVRMFPSGTCASSFIFALLFWPGAYDVLTPPKCTMYGGGFVSTVGIPVGCCAATVVARHASSPAAVANSLRIVLLPLYPGDSQQQQHSP